MQFSIITALTTLLAMASAATIETPAHAEERRSVLLMERQALNGNRPVPNGGCCAPNKSLKQDFCTVNGQSGKCVPANVNGCGGALTCIEESRLTCDPNRQERGRIFCRL